MPYGQMQFFYSVSITKNIQLTVGYVHDKWHSG